VALAHQPLMLREARLNRIPAPDPAAHTATRRR
jgi:hypothetical protein